MIPPNLSSTAAEPLRQAIARVVALGREERGEMNLAECEILAQGAERLQTETMSDLITSAIHIALTIRNATARREMLEALIGLPGGPDVRCPAAGLILARALDYQADADIPLLHQAGFRVKDHVFDLELVAQVIGMGRWPSPQLLCPTLPARKEIRQVIIGLMLVLPSDHCDPEGLIDNLHRLEQWGQQPDMDGLPLGTHLGAALTSGLEVLMAGKLWEKLGQVDPERAVPVLGTAMQLGMRIPRAAMRVVGTPVGDAFLSALTQAETWRLEQDTAQATAGMTARGYRL